MKIIGNLLIFIFFLSFQSTFAQFPQLVADLNPGAASAFEGNYAGLKVTLGNRVIFVAKNADATLSLMVSDGSASGTQSLLPAYHPDSILLSDFVIQGGKCWFLKHQNAQSAIWSTDGTAAGTQLEHAAAWTFSQLSPFKDGLLFIRRSSNSFDSEYLTKFQPADSTLTDVGAFGWFAGIRDYTVTAADTIYAIGDGGTSRNLYKSNGDWLSLNLVKNINTGSEFNSATYMYPVGNKVFFFWQKSDANEPYKLWVSDGTEAGTKGLAEFEVPSFQDLRAERAFSAFNGKFYFRGKQPAAEKGFELYVSDGTVAGTKLLKDFNTGLADSSPKNFKVVNGKLWVSASNDWWNPMLWSTNGATATNITTSYNYVGTAFELFRDSVFTTAYSSAQGAELISIRSSGSGIRTITDYSATGQENFFARQLLAADSVLYLNAKAVTGEGYELWAYRLPVATSAVNEASLSADLSVYPNPVANTVTINAVSGNEMSVYDSFGRLVETRKMAGQAVLNTSGWASGIYQVVVQTDRGLISTQISKL